VRSWLAAVIVLISMASRTTTAAAADDKVDRVMTSILTLCVGGGSSATIHSNEQNQFRIETGSGGVTLERHEAQGLVDGLNSKITAVEADQANRVRDCIQPYRSTIMGILLHPATAVPEPPAQLHIPPATSVSLLATAYRTNFADESTNFGRIPTIGLNPNVNDYTPNYINRGAVITTGELRHAMNSGVKFALIDVLTVPHRSIPAAFLLPGAGMVDNQDDRAKQDRFVNQLRSITGGSYDYPIVFSCQGVKCWESFNAATRAIIGGFRNVYWYRGGLNAWFSAPTTSVSLLAPAYRTNYMDEATDFGRLATVGLNPNVSDYTPTYIDHGAVITTGELRHAIDSGVKFAMIDVLTMPHTSVPGAFLLPGAGMVDSRDDRTKQEWFVNQLRSITGGSYEYPVVFTCVGVKCWESYNAAIRAIFAGFRNVYWYRGGLNAWFSAGPPP
jgi:rhodanese-related sulfurtransferase